MQVFQGTLANEVVFSGIGLHSGQKVNVRISPAPQNTGIVFVRTDIQGSPSVKASPENLYKLSYATSLSKGKASVQTIEHLMAAFSAFGIDNAFVYLDAPEVPILDGSSAPYIYLFKEAGTRKQSAKRFYLKLKQEVEVENNGKYIKAEPCNKLIIDNTISFNHTYKPIQYQNMIYEHNLENFESISKARTFCFYSDIDMLRSMGLAMGGSLDNAIVIDKYSILNSNGLRIKNEFIAHKTLDMVGDLYILGKPLLAKIKAFKTGHALNAKFVKRIFSEGLYEVLQIKTDEKAQGYGQLVPCTD